MGACQAAGDDAAATLLAQAEARYHAMCDASPMGMYATNKHGQLVYANARWQSIFAMSLQQALGTGWFAAVHPEDLDELLTRRQHSHGERAENETMARLLHADGRVAHVHMRRCPTFDADGAFSGHVGQVEDVTERLAAERVLRDERQRLASIIDATRVGTWERQVQTGEWRCNEQWAGIVGYALAELGAVSSQTWVDLTHPDDVARSAALLDAHFAGDSPSYESELRMRHRDGHWVWVLTRGRVITWTRDGKPEWMFGTHMDLTARKQQEEALRKSEAFLSRIGEVAGVGGWELDLATRCLYWSPQVRQLMGRSPDYQPQPSDILGLYAPEAQELVRSAGQRAMAGGGGWDLELPVVRDDGRRIWVRLVGDADIVDGQAVRLLGAFQDITERVEQRRGLERVSERLALATESGAIGIWEFDTRKLEFNMDGLGARAYGLASSNRPMPLQEWLDLIHPDDREATLQAAQTALAGGPPLDIEFRVCWPDGSVHHLRATARMAHDGAGDAVRLVGANWDVTEQRRLASEMSYRASHDALTGLINRAEFELRLRCSLKSAHDEGSNHALMYIDLDQFKLVNDACGHTAGDQLLQQVSRLLSDTVRSGDTLARLGGDEFAVILEHCTTDQAQRAAQAICDRMEDFRFVHEGRRFRIGTSIGLVPVDRRWATSDAAMQAADTSCYAAKDAGRNRVHTWFDTDLAMHARDGETQWAPRIEQALDEDRFVLYAQRIAPVGASATAGDGGLHAEVLLRMLDAGGGLIAPGAFLPAAERFHLASRIDRWVLRHACEWLAAPASRVAASMLCVNLSGQSIGDRAFHRHALELLGAAGGEVCRVLCFEITETAAVTNLADAAVFIEQVRRLGVRIALDDFGAGASSFGYLKNLKVDVLKIDGQFIRDLLDDPLDDVAVRCFVDVARVMGLQTVAEFVDRPELLVRLHEIGVDYAQGFLLHKPAPIDELIG